MADLDYTVSVNTTQAQRNIDALNDRVEKVSEAFAGMRNAIAGLALGALIGRSIAYADAIADIADATGLATEKIMGFSQAVTLSGGSADQANDGILKLVNAVAQAADGSVEAQKAFQEVGVSLNDLRTLSEADIFEKAIKGLGEIDDVSKRASLSAQLLGKSFRGVNLQNVAQSYGPAIAQQREYASAVENAAALQDKLDRTFIRIQASVLKAIEPISKFVGSLDEQKIQAIIDSLVQMTTVLVGLGAAFKGIEWIGRAFAFMAVTLGLVSGGMKSLSHTVGAISTRFGGLFKDIAKGTSVLVALKTTMDVHRTKTIPYLKQGIGMLAKGMLGWIGVIWLVVDAIKALTGLSVSQWFDSFALSIEKFVSDKFPKLAKAINSLGEMLGMAPAPSIQLENENEMTRLKNRAAGQKEINDALAKQAENAKQVREVEDQRGRQMMQFRMQQKQYLDDLQYGLKLDVSRIAFERDLIIQNGQLLRLTEDQIVEARVLQQIDEQRVAAVRQLNAQIEQLKASASEDANAQAKILVLQQQIKEVNKAYYDQTTNIAGALRSLQDAQYTAKVIEEDRLRTIEDITTAYDTQKVRVETLADQLKNVNDLIKGARFEGATRGKMPFEIDRAKLIAEIDKMARDAQQAFAASFGDVDALGPERMAQLMGGLEQIKAKFEELKGVQVDNLDASRTWASGWATAFAQFADDATNAANKAKEAFTAVMGNMNSAIDNFVDTGKFKFSDLATSIIRDLIKIELKAAASKVMSPILGAIGSGLGSLLGFAEGGSPPINKPSIVGEKGPELFVPKTAGTVVPNDALGGQANVTNNYITNNIQAVDAKSVAQLFAENRRQLLGTVRLAEKELSYR